jgi:hypothetical protein
LNSRVTFEEREFALTLDYNENRLIHSHSLVCCEIELMLMMKNIENIYTQSRVCCDDEKNGREKKNSQKMIPFIAWHGIRASRRYLSKFYVMEISRVLRGDSRFFSSENPI